MATDLAKAYVQIIPSAEGMKARLKEILGNEMPSGSEHGESYASGLASKIKAVIAAAGIGKALQSSLAEGANLQQSLGGVETLFKDSADKVIENAKNAYKTAGMSANQYMETVTGFSASLLQGLSGDTNKAAEVADMALTDMADNANKMGTSMESIKNAYQGFAKQNYTMLDNLKLGYGGTKTEMERLLADAEKLTGVKYDINNLSDVYEAIHEIQEEMGITGATTQEAEKTFLGSLSSMKAAFKNVLGNLSLGEDIGPSLYALSETVFTFAAGNLLPMIGNVLSGIPELINGVMSMAVRGLNLVANNADIIVQNGIDLITGLVTGIISALPYLAEAAIHIVASLGNAIINTDWIAVATETITVLKDNMDTAAGEILGTDGNIVESVINAINTNLPGLLQSGIEIVMNIATGVLDNIPTIISSAGEVVTQFLECIMENLPNVLSAGVTLILNLVTGIIDSLPQIIASAISVVMSLLNTILENAPQLIEAGLTLIGELIAGIIKAVPGLLGTIPGIVSDMGSKFLDMDWPSIGADIIGGIVSGVQSAARNLVDAAAAAAQDALNWVKNKLGIQSPSKVFRDEVGKMIDMGLAAGIENNAKYVIDSMKELSNNTIGTANNGLGEFANGIQGDTRNIVQNRNDTDKENLGNYIVSAMKEYAEKQSKAIEKGIASIKIIIDDREVVRFLVDEGFARG